MADPVTGGAKRTDAAKNAVSTAGKKELTERQIKRERIRAEKKTQREAEKNVMHSITYVLRELTMPMLQHQAETTP